MDKNKKNSESIGKVSDFKQFIDVNERFKLYMQRNLEYSDTLSAYFDHLVDKLQEIEERDALEGERRSKLKRRSAAKKAEFTRRKPS